MLTEANAHRRLRWRGRGGRACLFNRSLLLGPSFPKENRLSFAHPRLAAPLGCEGRGTGTVYKGEVFCGSRGFSGCLLGEGCLRQTSVLDSLLRGRRCREGLLRGAPRFECGDSSVWVLVLSRSPSWSPPWSFASTRAFGVIKCRDVAFPGMLAIRSTRLAERAFPSWWRWASAFCWPFHVSWCS